MSDYNWELIRIMLEKNINVKQLAKASGLSRGTISNMRRSSHRPHCGSIYSVCQVLEIKPEEIGF